LGGFILSGLISYSVVFWEHGPALTLFLVAVVLYLTGMRRAWAVPWWLAPILAAVRWRPELLVAFVAFAVTTLVASRERDGFRTALIQSGAVAVLGIAALLIEPRALLGAHVIQNLPGSSGGFFSTRASVYSSWFVDPGNAIATFGLLLWLSGTALAAVSRKRAGRRVALTLAALGSLSILYYFFRGSLGPRSFLSLSPGLMVVPWLLDRAGGRQRMLLAAGGLSMLAILLLSPTDGMFQFGPRFLLAPMALVSAGIMGCLGGGLRNRSSILVGAALLLSMLGSARGVAFQEYFRRRHADLAAAIERLPRETVVFTDEPWLPLVLWRLAMDRPLLVAPGPMAADSLSGENMTVVWVSSETVMQGPVGEPGYRGLRLSGEGPLRAPPGPEVPKPPGIAL
jgi:hypothetical protein